VIEPRKWPRTPLSKLGLPTVTGRRHDRGMKAHRARRCAGRSREWRSGLTRRHAAGVAGQSPVLANPPGLSRTLGNSEKRARNTSGFIRSGRGVAELATSQYQHDVAFRNRYVGIRSTGPPINQRPTALLKRLLMGEPPSLFDMDGVAQATGEPPPTMLVTPNQMVDSSITVLPR